MSARKVTHCAANNPGSLSSMISKKKHRRQEAGTEQGPHGQIEVKDDNKHTTEAEKGGLGRTQGCHPDL